MTQVTIVIEDTEDGHIAIEGKVDPAALNEPPTPALVIGSYLAAEVDKIVVDALAWFHKGGAEPPPEQQPVIKEKKLYVPEQKIVTKNG